MESLIGIGILLVIIFFLYLATRPTLHIRDYWSQYFDFMHFSTQEFYALVEEAVNKREIPDVSISRKMYGERFFLSARREHLIVTRFQYYFDICAAPFGTSFFVSCRLIQKESFIKRMMSKSQNLKGIANLKTFYQEDTEAMFNGIVRASITEAIDEMTKGKGIRGFSEI